MKNLFLLITSILILNSALQGQQEIKLYPEGQVENSGISADEENFDNHWVTNVTEARMYAYIAHTNIGKSAAVLICPGGGYGGLAVQHEGSQFAIWLNSLGISAFVLYYRMPNHHYQIPLSDAQTAMELIYKRAKEWNIDKNKIGVAGFSAGGHLASTVGTHFAKKNRPAFMILVYPVISMTGDGTCKNLLGENPSAQLIEQYSSELQVTPRTPSTLIIAATDDDLVPVEHSEKFYNALQAKRVNSELCLFKHGGHGFGMRKSGADTDQWLEVLEIWLKNRELVK